MRGAWGLFLGTLTAAALALALGGTAPFGRVALALGLPGLAAPLFDDPDWRGVAQYRAGDFDAAAASFRQARALFNLGNAETQADRLAAALEAYDRAAARGDADARANFDLVASHYASLGIDPDALAQFPRREDGPTVASFVARGDGRAAGTGSEVTNSKSMLGLAELESRGDLRVRQVFDDRFMVPDDRWLTQLPDVPGDYMAARIEHEHRRRVKLGLAPPPPEDPR